MAGWDGGTGSGGMVAGVQESAARMVFLTHLGDVPTQQIPVRRRPSLAVAGRGLYAGIQGFSAPVISSRDIPVQRIPECRQPSLEVTAGHSIYMAVMGVWDGYHERCCPKPYLPPSPLLPALHTPLIIGRRPEPARHSWPCARR